MDDVLKNSPFPHIKCPNRPLKTGSWRILRPVIDHDKCVSCLLCWIFCPDGVIEKYGKKIQINLDYCKGCGICAKECSKNAISMIEEGFHE